MVEAPSSLHPQPSVVMATLAKQAAMKTLRRKGFRCAELMTKTRTLESRSDPWICSGLN
jgi:hypothetical protein